MKKLTIIPLLVLIMFMIGIAYAPTGTIRIDPTLPLMTVSPAAFEVWAQGAGDPTYDPHILLVMTEASWNAMTDDVDVDWDGDFISFTKDDFAEAEDNYVPMEGATEGARYTVASLKSHLETVGPIYWVMGPVLDDPLHTSPKAALTVTLPSDSPRMLVYMMGRTAMDNPLFDTRIPPTIPGFITPELGTLLLALAPFSALALYAFRRKRA